MDIMLERIQECIGYKHGAKKELAEYLGISGNNITSWFSGRLTSYKKYAPQIADFYNVSLDWLSGRSDNKYDPNVTDKMDIMLERLFQLIGGKHGAKKELADAIGIPANVITDWRAGRNKSYPKYAPAIAEHYGVSLDWLSGRTDEKSIKKEPAAQEGDELVNAIILGRDGKTVRRTYTKEQMDALRQVIDVMPYLDDEEL